MSTIYLIDDHQMVRQGVRGLLEAAGHEVVGETEDPLIGIQEVLKIKPDLILLDLMLKDSSGLLFLSEIIRYQSEAKIIVLSMSDQIVHIHEARKIGAMGYVLKGASSSELLNALNSVESGNFYFPLTSRKYLESSDFATTRDVDLIFSLSVRERQILELVVRGKTSAQIASMIFLSPKTVETYRSRLMRKLEVSDVTELVRLAIDRKII